MRVKIECSRKEVHESDVLIDKERETKATIEVKIETKSFGEFARFYRKLSEWCFQQQDPVPKIPEF